MYDMGKAYRSGIKGSVTLDARKAMLAELAETRWKQKETGDVAYMNTFPVSAEEARRLYDILDPVNREFFTYYRTSRGRIAANVGSIRNDSLSALMSFFPFENLDLMEGRARGRCSPLRRRPTERDWTSRVSAFQPDVVSQTIAMPHAGRLAP